MSIALQLLNEFRPLFHTLEDPRARAPASLPSQYNSISSVRPALDVSEERNNYVVEVELPGVPKEDVDIRIGDHGHSLTIEGKVTNRRTTAAVPDNAAATQTNNVSSSDKSSNTIQAVQSKQLSVERQFVANTSFKRTVWLARPVDGSRVAAHLKDGILTLTLPKSEDKGSIKVSVE